jgi:hypothetical protein
MINNIQIKVLEIPLKTRLPSYCHIQHTEKIDERSAKKSLLRNLRLFVPQASSLPLTRNNPIDQGSV